jgi:type IV secretion system protein VirD4
MQQPPGTPARASDRCTCSTRSGSLAAPRPPATPFDRIDAAAPDAAEDAALLADALITDPPHQVVEAHWNEEAKALLVGLILFVAAEEASSRKNLATVRDLLTLPIDRFERLLIAMQDSQAAGGLVARAANRHLPPTGISPRATARHPASSLPHSGTRIFSTARA